ncbi:MAG: Hsp70 family protein [Planctomycetales bacterium]|nr:Hsp70 family protein [Planctomycetales bacterium]
MTTADQTPPSRFVVGLDLGTTNSAMAYVDAHETPRRIRTFAIPQVVAPGQIEARDTLPSFHYQPASGEFPDDSTRMPWSNIPDAPAVVVGHFARDHGTLVPGRMISSAKSWLCHAGVDRTADLLPWQGAEDVERLSPVAVSARYLQHAREAWDAQFPEHPLSQQDFVLTLPASFDEVARELTVKAAKQAGLTRIVLIEEPQAAFYAWIDKHAANWSDLVSPGQKILVCDVGGGTSDFTLIRVKQGESGTVQFHRVAVGDHLILGGDNCDLALAHHIERRLKGDGHLEPRQWSVLVRSCRQAKEVLMADDAPDKWTLTLPGGGSKLIGGGLQVPITRDEVRELLVNGFFPEVLLDAKPLVSQSGFQEFGLPYAADPAVTTHLAAFLTAHRFVALNESRMGTLARPLGLEQDADGQECPSDDPARPDIVLFNGGVFASPILQRRVVESLERWFRSETDPHWTPVVLENERLDLAVARGAAYYGMVRRGEGVRIAAGLARTYYVGVESNASSDSQPSTLNPQPSALCLLPAGIEPGHEVDLTQRQFELLVSQPIEFPLYVSSIRLTDKPGDLVAIDPERIRALPPIRTVLKQGKSKEAGSVTVVLQAKLTEIGTLDLWCREVDGKRSWKLLFDVRSATQTDIAAHDAVGEQQGVLDDGVRRAGAAVIAETFTGDDKNSADPDRLTKRLVETLGIERGEWPTTLLRQLWDALMEVESGRARSPQHEARWLNLTGFALRPGYGLAVDDWRVTETWKRLGGKVAHNTPASRAELSILWRRVAGGLTAGQQQSLTSPLLATVRTSLRASTGLSKGNDFGRNAHESAETLRLLGACELLPVTTKVELGEMLLDLLARDRFASLRSAALWALARVGARRLVYGPLNVVVSPDVTTRWLNRLMQFDNSDPLVAFAVMQLARKTGDRYRDIDETTRRGVLTWMDRIAAPQRHRELVREVGTLEAEDQSLLFGESLPKGLRIA